jgi:hypothetical protein
MRGLLLINLTHKTRYTKVVYISVKNGYVNENKDLGSEEAKAA